MKNKKSVISIILILVMLLSLLPLSVCAAAEPIAFSYTLDGDETYLESLQGGSVPFSADSLNLYISASASEVEAQLFYFSFEKEVMLPADVSVSGNCVSVVPYERLEEGARHKIVINSTNGSFEVFFNVTKSKNDLLLFHDDFEDESVKMSISRGEGAIAEKKDLSGNKMLYMNVPSGVNSAIRADAISQMAEQESYVIIDTVINPVKIDGDAYVGLFDSKNTIPSWRMGARMHSDGFIYIHNASNNLEKVSAWQAGVPFRFTALYDLDKGECSVYIDNILKKTVTSKKTKTSTFCIELNNANGGEAEIYIDNLKIYSGAEIVPDSAFNKNTRYSKFDYTAEAKKAIGSAWVFTDAQYYYKDGAKQKYETDEQKPLSYEGEMYVSEEFVNDILGFESAELEKTLVNNSYLISAKKLSKALGKEYLYDERGFFILSDGEFPYINSHDFTSLFEESDYIYRYVNFHNPKSEEILQDLKNNIGENTHPRLYYTEDDIEYIKNKAKEDNLWERIYNKAIADANGCLLEEITLTADCTDSQKQNQAGLFQPIMEKLSAAYLLTGNEAYAKKGMEYMDIVCEWESMGYTTSNLITGHWAMGMAVGYDAFYNYMMKTEEGREKAAYYRQRVRQLPFRDTLDALLGRQGREMLGGKYITVHWMKLCDNFQGAIGGGLMALALSMADEEDMYEKSMYMLENLVRTMEIPVSLYMPDGGYFESVAYSEYMLTNLSNGITSLFNCCGTDYGLGNAKGFTNAGEFFVYMQTPENRLNFSDCDRTASNTMLPAFFARYYGKTHAAKMTIEENKFRDVSYDMLQWLNFYKAIEENGEVDISQLDTDRYYYGAESGTFRNAFGTETPTFAGFHGGTTGRAHDMLDTGEFVFEAGGVPWAIDLGGDKYGLPSYFGTAGYKIYRKHTQGENCVLINPLTDSDEYFGQAIGEEAPLISYVSKPKGAFVAFDMTNVYKRDTTSYKRGYYFGDNRNTLTIQDEITLKDTSELYWFMHTVADIEIVDGDTARLSYGGEELLLKVYSNKPFTLSKMAAEPLDGTPKIEGQSENDGISKVSIHFENVSGEVNIAVKLIYQSKYFEAAPLSFIPIDMWSVEDGICDVKPVLTDIYIDPFKKMSASLQIPFDAKEAYILADGEEICKINISLGSVQKLAKIDVSALESGIYKAKLKVLYQGGSEEIIDSGTFIVEEFENSVFYANDMAREGSATEKPDGWSFYFGGSKTQNSDFVTLETEKGGHALLQFRASDKSYSIVDEIITMQCDIMFSSLDGSFNIECMNDDGKWFFHNLPLFQNGAAYDGSSYEANCWYKIRLTINTKSRFCSFYVDDKAIILDKYINEATGNHVYKLQFSPISENGSISYKNFKVTTINSTEGNALLRLYESDGGMKAYLAIKDISLLENKNMKLVLCAYRGNQLDNINIFDVQLSEDEPALEKEILLDGTETAVKCFLVDASNILEVVTKSVYTF